MPTQLRQCGLVLQWHITHACDQRCRHCYLFNSAEQSSPGPKILNWESCARILDDLVLTANRWNTYSVLVLTGGDPLLHPHFFRLLRYARQRNVSSLYILGNPFHLDRSTARNLAECGVTSYQISLDGMQQTHDALRRRGSFDESLRAVAILREAGIHTTIAFTLSRINRHELLDVMRLAADLQVGSFGFDLLTPTGRGQALSDQILTPAELRETFRQVATLEQDLAQRGVPTRWGRKANLWRLWLYELGKLNKETLAQAVAQGEFLGGCAIGEPFLTIQADGTVLPCPRLPIPIGRMPDDTISQILTGSELLKRFRLASSYQKCSKCPLVVVCRGCPAHAYSLTNDPFAPDPQCWWEGFYSETAPKPLMHHTQHPRTAPAATDSCSGLLQSRVDRLSFTAQEMRTLSGRGFWWRKLIERDGQPHLCHPLFADDGPLPPMPDEQLSRVLGKLPIHLMFVHDRHFAFDPLSLCIFEVTETDQSKEVLRQAGSVELKPARHKNPYPPTVRISTRTSDTTAKIPTVPCYLLIEDEDCAPDPKRVFAIACQMSQKNQVCRIGLRMPARHLEADLVALLKRLDLELMLDFQWPADFEPIGNRTRLALSPSTIALLDQVIGHYAGRLTARIDGLPFDFAVTLKELLSFGFRSLDLPQLPVGLKSRRDHAQWDDLLAMFSDCLHERAIIDLVPLTNLFCQLHARHTSLHNQNALGENEACLQCWAYPLCGGAFSHHFDSKVNCLALSFFEQAVAHYIALAETDSEGLRILCETPPGLLQIDHELSATRDSSILYRYG